MADEKIALVTGTISEIGWEIARGLLRADHTVIAHGRSVEKAKREAERVVRRVEGASLDSHTLR